MRDVLTLRHTSEAPIAPPPLPRALRPVAPLDTAATESRVMVLTQGMINGRMMDLERIDVAARLGDTEIWARAADSIAESVLRGRQLVTTHGCGDCHGGFANPAAKGYLAGLMTPGAGVHDRGLQDVPAQHHAGQRDRHRPLQRAAALQRAALRSAAG